MCHSCPCRAWVLAELPLTLLLRALGPQQGGWLQKAGGQVRALGEAGLSGNHRSEARVQVSNGVGVSVLLRWVPGNSAFWSWGWGPHQSWGPDEDWSWG